MRVLGAAVVAAFIAAFAPSCASAADNWLLSFDVADPSGHPSTVDLLITDLSTTPYVEYFAVPGTYSDTWTTVLNTTANGATRNLLSTVTLTPNGGSIEIGPSIVYDGFYDGFFILNLNYTLSAPQPVGSVFDDSGVTGSGSYSYYVNASFGHPGVEDISGGGRFVLTGLSAAIPEPASWGLMIMGFGGLGAILRRRRASFATA